MVTWSLYKFWEMADISQSVQDSDIVAMED